MNRKFLNIGLTSFIILGQTNMIALADNYNSLNVPNVANINKSSIINKKGKVVNVASNDSLNVRKSYNASSTILFTLKNNTEIYVKTQVSNGWYQIEYNGKTGFVNGNYIKLLEDNLTTIKYQVTGDINIRKTASWSGEKVAIAKKNSILNVLDIANNWAKILYNNSVLYAPASYLVKVTEDSNTEEEIPLPEIPNKPENGNEDIVVEKYKTTADLNLRVSNSWSSKILTIIKRDTVVNAMSTENGWIKVEYNNFTGYLPLSHLVKYNDNTNVSPNIEKIATVNAENLNVRTGPSVNYPSISKLYRNNVVLIKEINSNGWYKIESITGVQGWCHGGYLKDIKNGSLPSIGNAEEALNNVIKIAKEQIGKPYLWGGEGPDAFDCSGLMLYSYKHGANITLPRDSYMQAEFGLVVKKENLKPGDLVFFDTMNKGRVSHVGIYLGNNQMLHAPNKSKPIQIVDINTSYWDSVYITSRRIIPN